MNLEHAIHERARALGFGLVGIAAAAPADDFAHLQDWLARGFAGDMGYLSRHAAARRHPESILADVRSVIMVGMHYHPGAGAEAPGRGRVARYARGTDYHDVLRRRLKQLLSWVEEQVPQTHGRAVVDTAPLLERDFARRAGLGWIGKNTMLIDKHTGSFFFLGALLLNITLTPDAPFEADHCGTCTRCLDACPTDAFAGPHQLDARRCISYLTIELRGPIEFSLRPLLGDWLFGCDVCQEVCPWNRKAPTNTDPELQPLPHLEMLEPEDVLGLSEDEFRARFRGTALLRPGRRGLLRNAAIVLGNRGEPGALPALESARHDPDPVIAEAADWAIEQIRARTLKSHATLATPVRMT